MTPEERDADLMAGLMDGRYVSHLTVVEMPVGHVHYRLTFTNGKGQTWHEALQQEAPQRPDQVWRRVICRLHRG